MDTLRTTIKQDAYILDFRRSATIRKEARKAAGVARTILDHWQLALWAALAGLALGCALLAAIYLAPLVRLLLARGRDRRSRVVEYERRRLRQLENALAVHQEHDHAEADELRRDAEIHRRVLQRMERQTRKESRP